MKIIPFLVLTLLFCIQPGYSFLDYRPLDRIVQETPQKYKNDMEGLVRYLIRDLDTDLEKAYVLFRWVVENIKYGEIPYGSDAFLLKKGVCADYTYLYSRMCRLAGLSDSVESCSGEVKDDYGRFYKLPHAWNALYLDGRAWLLDTTWSQFLTVPEVFLYSHWGDSVVKYQGKFVSAQLVDPPLKIEDWARLNYQVTTNNTARFYLKTEAQLIFEPELICDRSDSGIIPDEFALLSDDTLSRILIQREKDGYVADIYLPFAGSFLAGLNTYNYHSVKKYPFRLPYMVFNCYNTEINRFFPRTRINFYIHDAYLESPRDGILKTKKAPDFKLTVPGAVMVRIDILDKPYPYSATEQDDDPYQTQYAKVLKRLTLEKSGNVFQGRLDVSEWGKKARYAVVIARFSGSETYYPLLTYKLEFR